MSVNTEYRDLRKFHGLVCQMLRDMPDGGQTSGADIEASLAQTRVPEAWHIMPIDRCEWAKCLNGEFMPTFSHQYGQFWTQ